MYKWDGENRLVRYTNPATNTSSSFTYDGLGRLVRIVDNQNGTISDHSYFWCGATRCLARNNTSTGALFTQYFSQGEVLITQINPTTTTAYYFVTDQLGSVLDLVNSGTAVTAYSYDSYGNQTNTNGGTVLSDIGYGGYFHHNASGLNFTRYRAYDAAHGRWLNRDPVGEIGGVNLYAYVGGNPATLTDALGWCPSTVWNDPNDITAGVTATGLYSDAPNDLSPTPSGLFDYGPIFRSPQFTQYGPAMNFVGNAFVAETAALLDFPAIGGMVADALGPSGYVFGRTSWGGTSIFGINSYSVLRIGWGWTGTATQGTSVFRLSGAFIDWLGVESGHIDLFTWPW
jgi:RHS repeat-associated protein